MVCPEVTNPVRINSPKVIVIGMPSNSSNECIPWCLWDSKQSLLVCVHEGTPFRFRDSLLLPPCVTLGNNCSEGPEGG